MSHSSTRPKRKRIKKNLLSLERKKKEGKKVIGSVVFLVVYQGYYRFRRLDADVRCDIFFFVLSTSNRRRGRYIACPAGVGNFFFFFPLFFFPLLFFMVCYHGHFLPHICTMHARGRKTKLCGILLTAFLPPPPCSPIPLLGTAPSSLGCRIRVCKYAPRGLAYSTVLDFPLSLSSYVRTSRT